MACHCISMCASRSSDRALAEQALAKAELVVVNELFLTATAAQAHVGAAAPRLDYASDPVGPSLYEFDVTSERVRFEDGDLHGFENTGTTDFEYLSVTSPPVNFRAAYERNWSGKGANHAQPDAAGDAPQAAHP